MEQDQNVPKRKNAHRHRNIVLVILAFVAGLLIAGLIAAQYVIHHAEPMMRARVIQALSRRFDSQV
ncbi:MAG: hypothetical protein WCD77_19195, partial [Acidobacteriaceae bacterium]